MSVIRKTKTGRFKVFAPAKEKLTALQQARRQRRFLQALDNNSNY